MPRASTKRDLAARADDIARNLERDAFATLRPIIKNPTAYGTLVNTLDDEGADIEHFSERIRRSLSAEEWNTITTISDISQNTPGEDAIQLSRWARNRIVYVIDPDAASAIVNTDWSDTVIPEQVLRRLPLPDPLVILPTPIAWTNTDGLIEHYEAMGVFGVREPRRRSSTHHPDVTHYALHFFGHLLDPATNKRLAIPVPDRNGSVHTVHPIVGMRTVVRLEDATMADHQRYAAQDMWEAGPFATAGFHTATEATSGIAEMTGIGLALLVYLVSDGADTRAAPQVRRPRASKSAGAGPASQVYEVGFRLGSALREHAARDGQRQTGSGVRTVAPHIRRAHLHTFRRGPGRTQKIIKWLPPIAVNPTGQPPTQATIHVK